MIIPQPPHWTAFKRAVRANCPDFPVPDTDPDADFRTSARRAYSVVRAALDGAGIPVPPIVGVAVNATQDSNTDAATGFAIQGARMAAARFMAQGGEVAAMGAGVAGASVANVGALFIRIGTGLMRVDATERYLISTRAYSITLSRAVVTAMNDSTPFVRAPTPPVPEFYARTGELYTNFRRGYFMDGYTRALRAIETDKPPKPGRDSYSKGCLCYIGALSGFTGGASQADFNWRIRRFAEQYILRQILGVSLRRQAERLRAWM